MTTYLQRILNFLLLASAAWYALAFIYVAAFSLGYPYGMEWLEGHVMETVARVARGEPVYTPPSIEYVPFMYTPFYYYAAALFTKFLGVDFMAGRVLSVCATFGISALLFAWARVIGGSRVAAFSAAGLYLAAYDLGGRWYDLARVDNLYVFLLLAGMFVLYNCRGTACALAAAVLLALAFYTKQSAFYAFLPLLLWTVWIHRRDGLVALSATAAIILVMVLASNYTSGGWFRFYVYDVPAGHKLDRDYVFGFFTGDLLRNWWPMLLPSLWLAVACFLHDKRIFFFFFALALGLVGSSYLARIHWGGHVNVLLPMFTFFALVAACAITAWWPARALVLVQFGLCYYAPNALIPGELLRANNDKAIEAISHLRGNVFVPDLHFIDWPLGKQSYVYGMAAFDVFRSGSPRVEPVKLKMRMELIDAFEHNRFDAIMPGSLLKMREADVFYPNAQRLPFTFRYLTGIVRRQSPDVRTSTSCC